MTERASEPGLSIATPKTHTRYVEQRVGARVGANGGRALRTSHLHLFARTTWSSLPAEVPASLFLAAWVHAFAL